MEAASLKEEEKILEKRRGRISAATGRWALFQKEFSDHLRSRRFFLLLLLIGGSAAAGMYGAIGGLSDTLAEDAHFAFLKLYTTGGNSIPSFLALIALLGPVVGIALGFDAINSERTSGTLGILISQPIYRDSIIIGKFLAGTALTALLTFTTGIAAGAAGVLATGLKPDAEEIGRILVFLTFTVVYIAFWLALSILFSVVCRHSATSALSSIAVWMLFAIFMSMIAGIIANAAYPIGDDMSMMVNGYHNYALKMNLNRISPYYLYTEAVSTIMNPSIRSVNVITMDQLSGAITGYLSFGQSLLLVWPHLTGLAALMLAAFGISYVGFMCQEIRTN